MPLYTIWREGTAEDIIFAGLHCTGGDILIATASLMLTFVIVGEDWPRNRRASLRVAGMAIAFGVGYTIFSEWLNIVIREAWVYSNLMPVIPVIDAGLSPILQWIFVPAIGFWLASRTRRRPHGR